MQNAVDLADRNRGGKVGVKVPARVLPVIVASQLAGTSSWFACNAVMPDLVAQWQLPAVSLGPLTSSVQAGFISGTLVFAILMIADRFSPRLIFLLCAIASAAFNAAATAIPAILGTDNANLALWSLMTLRFATGFFLAGIYPVGMKIAASWYDKGLGAALGLLVGALVLGTAMPHALRAMASSLHVGYLTWEWVMWSVSTITVIGGLLMYAMVPNSPRLPRLSRMDPRALFVIWSDHKVRASAFGYFGHMWELYTFWLLVPLVLARRLEPSSVSLAAFVVIGCGFFGCVIGGFLARAQGSASVAATQLATSGLCCLASPLLLDAPLPLFLAWLVIWGITVVGDSPQLSALTANNAPRDRVGSVLTFVNCIGFAITIVSMQIIGWLARDVSLAVALSLLALGPALGLLALRPLLRGRTVN